MRSTLCMSIHLWHMMEEAEIVWPQAPRLFPEQVQVALTAAACMIVFLLALACRPTGNLLFLYMPVIALLGASRHSSHSMSIYLLGTGACMSADL